MDTVQVIRQRAGLNLFNGDGAFGANLNTGLTAQALVGIYRISLAVNQAQKPVRGKRLRILHHRCTCLCQLRSAT